MVSSIASVESEEKLILVLVSNPPLIKTISSMISCKYFYISENKVFFERLLELDSRGIMPTKETFIKEGSDVITIDRVDDLFNRLEEGDYEEEQLFSYINHIKECFEYRTFQSMPSKIIEIRDSDEYDYEMKKTKIVQLVNDFGKLDTVERDYSTKSAVLSVIDRIEKAQDGYYGIDTGIERLDQSLLGLEKGELIIFASRPGVGKSLVTTQIMTNLIKQGNGVILFNYEMSKEEIMIRMLSSETNIPHIDIITGRLTDDETVLISDTLNAFLEMPVLIVDDPSITINDMKNICNTVDFTPSCVIVDYLQLMPIPKGKKNDTRSNELGQLSAELKRMSSSRELDVFTIALSQLSRSIEQRGDNIPRLSDLRESGNIEQDANRIVMMTRDADCPDAMLMHIKKQRNRAVPHMPISVNLDVHRSKVW